MEFLHGEMLAQTSCVKLKPCTKDVVVCWSLTSLCHSNGHIETTLHKRALRTVHNKSHNSHTDPLFKQSGIPKLSDLHQLEAVLFMHDYVHTTLPLSFNNLFKLNCDVYDAYETRRAQMFHIPRTKSRFVDKLPLYNFSSMWNNSIP